MNRFIDSYIAAILSHTFCTSTANFMCICKYYYFQRERERVCMLVYGERKVSKLGLDNPVSKLIFMRIPGKIIQFKNFSWNCL